MIQDVVSFSDSLCSGKCVRCRIILPLYYFLVSVCHSLLCLSVRRLCLLSLTAVSPAAAGLGAALPPRCRQLCAELSPAPRCRRHCLATAEAETSVPVPWGPVSSHLGQPRAGGTDALRQLCPNGVFHGAGGCLPSPDLRPSRGHPIPLLPNVKPIPRPAQTPFAVQRAFITLCFSLTLRRTSGHG